MPKVSYITIVQLSEGQRLLLPGKRKIRQLPKKYAGAELLGTFKLDKPVGDINDAWAFADKKLEELASI